MADASVTGGVQHHGPPDARHLPTLSPAEEQAARLALSKLGTGAGTITQMAGGDATMLAGAGSGDTPPVGAGTSIVISGAHPPTLQSGSDQVVAGSNVPVHAAAVPGTLLRPEAIGTVGPTAAGIKAAQAPTPAGVTMTDHTKVNVSGVSPADIAKHSGHG